MAHDNLLAGLLHGLAGDGHLPADDIIGDVEQRQCRPQIVGAKREVAPVWLRGRTQAQPVTVGKPSVELRRSPVRALARQSCGDLAYLALRPDDQAAEAGVDMQ